MRSVRADHNIRCEHFSGLECHGWSLRVRVDVDDITSRAERCAMLYCGLCEDSSEIGVLSGDERGFLHRQESRSLVDVVD